MAQHLIQDNPEGPEIHFQPIRLLKQDFWSTVLERADARRRGVASFLEPPSYAEVRYHEMAILGNHDVLWLEIPMNNAMFVNDFDGKKLRINVRQGDDTTRNDTRALPRIALHHSGKNRRARR